MDMMTPPGQSPQSQRETIAAELEARRQTSTAKPAPRSWQLWAIIGAAVVVLLGGTLVYIITTRHRSPPQTASTATNSQTGSPAPSVTPDSVTDNTISPYVSNGKDLNLTFSYPTSWQATPASGNNSDDRAVTLTSPLVRMASADNVDTTAKVVVSIRPGNTPVSETADGKAVTALASTQIAYTKPTPIQHQYPYITFVHLAGGNNQDSAFEEIFITGSLNYPKNQTIGDLSLTGLDPIISVRFYTCASQACPLTSATPLSITASTWQNDPTCQQVLAIFESIQIH